MLPCHPSLLRLNSLFHFSSSHCSAFFVTGTSRNVRGFISGRLPQPCRWTGSCQPVWDGQDGVLSWSIEDDVYEKLKETNPIIFLECFSITIGNKIEGNAPGATRKASRPRRVGSVSLDLRRISKAPRSPPSWHALKGTPSSSSSTATTSTHNSLKGTPNLLLSTRVSINQESSLRLLCR